MTASGYHEYRPPSHLRAGVACFWSNAVDATAHDRTEWVVPDNCADLMLQVSPDDALIGAFVVGPMTRPLALRAQAVRFVGARFHPGWLTAALGVPAHELRDRRVPIGDVSPRLRAVVRRAGDDPHGFLQALVNVALADAPSPPPIVREALGAIEASAGRVRIEHLCRGLRVSRQHLARQFDVSLGVTPRFAGRVVRMQHVLQRAPGVARGEWSRLALESGYADQSHLIDDLRELTGRTPTQLAS